MSDRSPEIDCNCDEVYLDDPDDLRYGKCLNCGCQVTTYEEQKAIEEDADENEREAIGSND